MKILVDSDVVLDVLAERQPFVAASAVVWALAEAGKVEAVVSALSFSNVYYIGRKAFGAERAIQAVRTMAATFAVAPVDGAAVMQALNSGMADFEDALQAFAGAAVGATHVVTRDAHGFIGGPLSVVAPDQLSALIASKQP